MDCFAVSQQNPLVHTNVCSTRLASAPRIVRHASRGARHSGCATLSSRGRNRSANVVRASSTLDKHSADQELLKDVWRELGVTRGTTLNSLVRNWEGCDAEQLRVRLQNMKRILRLSDRDLRDMANNRESVLLDVSLCTVACRVAEVRDSLPFNTDTYEVVGAEPSLLTEPDIGAKIAAIFVILKAAMPDVDIDSLAQDQPATMAMVVRDCLDGHGDPSAVHPFLAGWLQGESSHATSRLTCSSSNTQSRISVLGTSWYKWPRFISGSFN